MKRLSSCIQLFFVLIILSSPLILAGQTEFIPAQTTRTFSEELVPDPYLAQEPYVEIGGYSPEFDYEFTPGSLSLIWMHQEGYQLDYYQAYPPTCNEYARVQQIFDVDYNESLKSIKISAFLRIECTGDFAAPDIMDDLYEVVIGAYHPLVGSIPIRTITDFKNGESEDISFMLSAQETQSILYSMGSTEELGLTIQLVPSFMFGQTFGNLTPWLDYDGSVILTITHMSFVMMLDGESLAPSLISPEYNSTLLQNETMDLIIGIETEGPDRVYQLRQKQDFDVSYSLFSMTSNHVQIENKTVYEVDPFHSYYGVFDFATHSERIALLTVLINDTEYKPEIRCIDSSGNLLWNCTFKLYYQDVPLITEFDLSGNLYVHLISIDGPTDPYRPFEERILHSIVKIDTLGNLVWNQTVKIQTYSEYVAYYGTRGFPTGLGCNGNNLIIGFGEEVLKLDPDGNELWRVDNSHDALCVDPAGGFYTFSNRHQVRTELQRWNTNGVHAWTRSLGWDYGEGWIEYPTLRAMSIESNGPLHLVLEYRSVEINTVLTRVTRAGTIASQDTIFELTDFDYNYYYNLPFVTDLAVTGDGLVHVVGGNHYVTIMDPFYPVPGTFMVTYDLPVISNAISPISLTMIGVASVLILGIAYDFFFRRKSVPDTPPEPNISDFEW